MHPVDPKLRKKDIRTRGSVHVLWNTSFTNYYTNQDVTKQQVRLLQRLLVLRNRFHATGFLCVWGTVAFIRLRCEPPKVCVHTTRIARVEVSEHERS